MKRSKKKNNDERTKHDEKKTTMKKKNHNEKKNTKERKKDVIELVNCLSLSYSIHPLSEVFLFEWRRLVLFCLFLLVYFVCEDEFVYSFVCFGSYSSPLSHGAMRDLTYL